MLARAKTKFYSRFGNFGIAVEISLKGNVLLMLLGTRKNSGVQLSSSL